jgi:hypothetical protein
VAHRTAGLADFHAWIVPGLRSTGTVNRGGEKPWHTVINGENYHALLLDKLLARLTVPGRPADLTDDMAWVRAASGRAPHSDPRLPLLG